MSGRRSGSRPALPPASSAPTDLENFGFGSTLAGIAIALAMQAAPTLAAEILEIACRMESVRSLAVVAHGVAASAFGIAA